MVNTTRTAVFLVVPLTLGLTGLYNSLPACIIGAMMLYGSLMWSD